VLREYEITTGSSYVPIFELDFWIFLAQVALAITKRPGAVQNKPGYSSFI
jgi:hypothetical protein